MYTKHLFTICLLISFLIAACSVHKKQELEKKPVTVEPGISQNSIYRMLDKQKDFQEYPVPEGDTVKLDARTSYVKYSRDDFNKDTSGHRINNCRSIKKNDTLIIKIGLGNLFTANGFIVTCHNDQFDIEPYYATDVIIENAPQPKFRVIYQRLILDKANYAVGDSLYGNVQFKIIERISGEVITHVADGYFRSKVKKQWFD